jgi:RNA polymerase sigma-70 factor (ECF subfamily)
MADWATHSDADLLQRSADGNEDAFAALYRKRQGSVYRFALRMSGNPDIAEEVTQEVFLMLIRPGHGYDPARGPLEAFLLGVARNHVRRCLDRDRAYLPLPDPHEDGEVAQVADAQDALGDLTRRENVEAIRRAVLTLPPDYREVVALCDLDEIDYADAAVILGCPVGTVRSRLHRARAMLVTKLRARCFV